jgi:subtilisin family serine protease
MHHRAARLFGAVLLAGVLLSPVAPVTVAAPAPVPAPQAAGGADAPTWAPDRVLVRYTASSTPGQRASARSAAGATKHEEIPGVPGLELVHTKLTVGQALGRLKNAKGVDYAQPDYEIHADLVPNDPGLSSQWAVSQTNGIDINAPAAWDVTTGGGLPVAVIDTGVQLNHPDLAANIWTNPGEIPGNGIDDDNDGYVDDVHGWDFVNNDNVPDDQNGHGTHVAGTIAAVGNNGIGVAGIAYSAKIVPLRVLDANGSGFVSDGVRAIAWAAAHHIHVANLSWTFGGAISQPLWDAIASAGDGGLLVAAAAGNSGNNADTTPEYPAAYDLPSIISVAALAADGTLAGFSNRGIASVDIAAPGVGILSTYKGSTYGLLSGTSMASPHVAGTAALLFAAHPGWTVAQVRDRILETAHPIASLAGIIGTGGLLDAGAALAPAGNRAPAVTITSPGVGTMVQPGTAVTFHASAIDPEDGDVSSSISWSSTLMGSLGTGASITRSNLVMGTHVIVATAHDSSGKRRSATLVVRVTAPISYVDEHAEPRQAAIAVAPDGTPLLSWAEDGKGTIVSRFGGSAWSREPASPAYAEDRSDPLVEPSGRVDVAIERDWGNLGARADNGILVASDDGSGQGTGWTEQRVSEGCGDDADGCGMDETPSLALDASGQLHVAWTRVPAAPGVVPGNDPGLWHAVSHANGAWTAELVLGASDVADPDVATGSDGSTHIVFWRQGGAADGLYHATNETGDWVVEQIAPYPADGVRGTTRVQLGAAGRVDVAWAGTGGVMVRSRVGGTWQAPVTVTTDAATDVDLVRDGSNLHLVYGLIDDTQLPSGIGYAVNTGSGWTPDTVDTGDDQFPRLAVDPSGHPHVSYSRVFPEHEVRHATNGGGGWTTDVVDQGWTWTAPSIGVDAAGHHHVAAGRSGTQPGIWYATDATGSWTTERLTQVDPDGPVSMVVAPDGTAAIAYAEYFDTDGTPLVDRAVWLIIGKPGAWSAPVRIATNTGGAGPSIARGPGGHLSIAFSTQATGNARIELATDATGSWVTSFATAGASATVDEAPSIAVDASGHVDIAYQERTKGTGNVLIRYLTNATGAWVKTLVTSGSTPRLQPRIGLTTAGVPRIAFWIQDSGIRLAVLGGTTWTITAVPSDQYDSSPALAVDAQGHSHLLWARSVSYFICAVPFCSDAPGLRYWSDTPGFGAVRRVGDFTDDVDPAITYGADGTVAGAFAAPAWHLGTVDLREAAPSVTAPAVHLASSGTVSAGQSLLTITFTGHHAALYALAQQIGSGAFSTVGAVNGTTTRSVGVGQSTTTTRRFRVTATDGIGQNPAVATGATFRTWGHSEAAGTGITYAGSWATISNTSFWGGKARYASSTSASVTWTVTAKELAWTALKSPAQGSAKVYVDGKLVATISLHSTSTSYRQVVFAKQFTTAGSHRLTIKPAGNGRVTLDGFLALR